MTNNTHTHWQSDTVKLVSESR